MKKLVVKLLDEALKEKGIKLKKEEIENLIEIPHSVEFGDYAFPCFFLAEKLKDEPKQIAIEIRGLMGNPPALDFDDVQTVGPYINFFVNRKRLIKIVDGIIERKYNFKWKSTCRVNYFTKKYMTKELLDKLEQSGCQLLVFGVESGSERTLHHIKKGCSKDQVRKSMIMAKSMGFETWGFFVIGFLGETREDIEATIEFALELDPTFIKFFVLHPTPGTEAYRELDEAGLIDDYDYSKVGIYRKPVHHLPDISAADLERYRRQANRRFYLRPRKIWQLLRRIDSWDRLMASWNGGKLILSNILGR